MKKFLWFISPPILLLVAYFLLPNIKNKPETESGFSTVPTEKPDAVAVEKLVSLSVSPNSIIQGDPARITIKGLSEPSAIKSLTLDGKPIAVFADKDELAALIGVDFHKKPGFYPVVLTLSNGQKVEEKLEVGQRAVATQDFDIPEQLGGNTPQAEKELTHTLSQDATILNTITSVISPEKLWDGEFRLPLDGTITITDTYGYERQTGSVSLSHLGTDFRAAEGTPVYAINSGKVAYTGTLRNFGETIIIDHGLGLMTLYMHLSKIKTQKDESIEKGDFIAESGSTGYSLGPHLHLSVRIGGLSIDPQKFYELMRLKDARDAHSESKLRPDEVTE